MTGLPLAVALIPCQGRFAVSEVTYSGPLWQCTSGPGAWAILQARPFKVTEQPRKGKPLTVEGILYADHEPTPTEWEQARRVLLSVAQSGQPKR